MLNSLLADTSKLMVKTVNLSLESDEVAKNFLCPLKGGVPDECVCGPDGTNYDYDAFKQYVKFNGWSVLYHKDVNGDFLTLSGFKSPTSRITYPTGAITTGHQVNNVLEHLRRQKILQILHAFERDTLKTMVPGIRKLGQLWQDLI